MFHQQCEREGVRLGATVTGVMLSKSFVINFSFFNGSNGAGTRHLLALAKMQQRKRADAREGVLEATDIQAALQRLRQVLLQSPSQNPFRLFNIRLLNNTKSFAKPLSVIQYILSLLRRASSILAARLTPKIRLRCGVGGRKGGRGSEASGG